MVFHDYNLRRVCGVNKKVSELDYEELLSIDYLTLRREYLLFVRHLIVSAEGYR